MALRQFVANRQSPRVPNTAPGTSPNPEISVRDRKRYGDLVPVTLVSADLDLQSLPLPDHDPSTDLSNIPSPSSPSTSKPPKRTKLYRYKRRAFIRYKCFRTRFSGRVALLEYRLPNWIRSYMDRRRDTKWRDSDAGLWHVDNGVVNHWDALGDGNVLDTTPPTSDPTNNDTTSPTVPQPNDPIPPIDMRSAGSFMGAALGTQPSAPPHAFDEHYRAYSVAMMPRGGNRDNVAYGGKSK
jgi:hypothetical protein